MYKVRLSELKNDYNHKDILFYTHTHIHTTHQPLAIKAIISCFDDLKDLCYHFFVGQLMINFDVGFKPHFF